MYKSVLSTFLSISFLCVFFCQKNIIEKAARKMLIISPIGNFIKILQAAFIANFFAPKNFKAKL